MRAKADMDYRKRFAAVNRMAGVSVTIARCGGIGAFPVFPLQRESAAKARLSGPTRE
jgi:hypothetical protein